jgi:hypothetical protein
MRILLCAWALPALAVLSAAPAMAGKIRFFEGNNGGQDNVGTVSADEAASINFKDKGNGLTNDEARSVRIWYATPGTVITVYDDPGGKENDDWARITVYGDGDFTIGTFEKSVRTDNYVVEYHHKNGLDGKVSHVKVEPAFREAWQTPRLPRLARQLDKVYDGFKSKGGDAFEFTTADSQYRLWTPDLTETADGGLIVTSKMDYIQGKGEDGHAAFTLRFDNKCGLVSATSTVTLAKKLGGKEGVLSGAFDAAKDLTDQVKDPRAKIALAAAKLATRMYDAARALAENGGQIVFPGVVEIHVNKIGIAVLDTCATPEKPKDIEIPIETRGPKPGAAQPKPPARDAK